MGKKEKEHKNSQKAFQDTLGTRLFAFGEHKIASMKKTVHWNSQYNLFAKKFGTPGRIGFQPGRKLAHRGKASISLVYVRPSALVSFEAHRTKKENSTPVQSVILLPRILKLLSSLKREFAKSPISIPSVKATPIPTLRGMKEGVDEQDQDTIHSPGILELLTHSPVVSNGEERRRTQEGIIRSPSFQPFFLDEEEGRKSTKTIPFPQRARVREKWSDQETTLPSEIQSFFSRLLRIRLPSVRIHQDTISDKFLSAHHADAMTVGRDIFFKPGKFDLKSARGLALLGHELTHVAQQQTSDWRNPPVSRSAEHQEHSARENERFILARTQTPVTKRVNPISSPLVEPVLSLSKGGVRGGMSSTTKTLPSISASVRPMFADESRDLSSIPDMRPEEVQSVTLSESEMSRIKEEVYRDLMMRIKIDFERGA